MAAYDRLEVTSAGALRSWLLEHHASERGVWLVTYKKRTDPDRHVTYEEVVREVLCFGWVDSQAKGVDDRRSSILLTPRRPTSGWSRPNKQRIAELTEAGLMQPAGLAVVEAAKASGSWVLLDDVENLLEPDDLRAALDADPTARRYWDAFPRTVRRATLQWIGSAKRPGTRAGRIAETATLASRDERANQWPRQTPSD